MNSKRSSPEINDLVSADETRATGNVGFPGSVDSPENPGFMASLGPGSVDSSALIEWTTVLQS